MTDQNNPLGMKTIAEAMATSPTEKLGEFYKGAFTLDWVFNKWWEKVIVAGSFFYSLYSVVMFVWRLL